jgi:hypothetical protein
VVLGEVVTTAVEPVAPTLGDCGRAGRWTTRRVISLRSITVGLATVAVLADVPPSAGSLPACSRNARNSNITRKHAIAASAVGRNPGRGGAGRGSVIAALKLAPVVAEPSAAAAA